MVRITRRRTLGLVASALPFAALSSSVMAASNASLSASPSTPGETATHTATVTVDGDAVGSSWNSLVLDYTGTGGDVSDVGTDDVSVIGIDRGDDASGATVDVDAADDVSSVSASNDGETLTLGLGGNYSLESGDELVVVVDGVVNPGEGTSTVTLVVNQQSAGESASADLTIGEEDDEQNVGGDTEDGDADGTEDGDTDGTDDDDADGTEEDERDDCASVSFDDQQTAGYELVVDEITLPDGGYAVVHTLDHDTLGVSDYLSSGTHENVTVELDTPLESDATLQAMAHRETNGNESYDHSKSCSEDGHYACDGDAVAENATVTVDADCE
ncbi:hypothetical protein [Haloferax sp. DFSO52]|uniref:DUF7282 domain-containing protein n=1 Tax=Haloferax sp. DFSO52 TaxID=3388505 RepID=UPI003A89BC16